ncbi:malonyl-ACP O-methyltransferase BioC [Teredinibacter haidensis]|uniref:malonyl-ACP O-methyltransferase BioC n=1 Tax=Teredinibacter haidensis TaxID=2731755 RepID=UPI0009F9B6F9
MTTPEASAKVPTTEFPKAEKVTKLLNRKEVSPSNPVADRSVLVFLHGWGCDSRMWDSFLPTLLEAIGDEREMVFIDLPGFGFNRDLAVTDSEELLLQLSRQLPANTTLIGWSLGGMIATQLASRHPEKVGRIITIATNPRFVKDDIGAASPKKPWKHAMERDVFDAFCTTFADDSEGTLKRFIALQSMGDSERRDVVEALESVLDFNAEEQSQSWLQALEYLDELDNRTALRNLTLPGLHIFGKGDTLVPAGAGRMVQRLAPSHWVETITGAGHAPHISHSRHVAAAINSFLDHQPSRPSLRKKRIANSFNSAAKNYDTLARLQKRVVDSLVKFSVGNSEPVGQTLLDLGCGTGYCIEKLLQEFPTIAQPEGRIHALDIAEGMLEQAEQKFEELGLEENIQWHLGDMESLPFVDETFDGCISSLTVQWSENPQQLFDEMSRALKPGGWFAFTTLGPETLFELRSAWQQIDEFAHVNQFMPLESIKEVAEQAGFNIVAYKSETPVLYYHDVTHLMRELKGIGAHTINEGRQQGLMGRRTFHQLEKAYSSWLDPDRGLPARYEVYYIYLKKA